MNIVAVIVTYNRLPLLKECVSATLDGSVLPDRIIVVNNGSTDGTAEWLGTQPLQVINQQNKGASDGFAEGVKRACEAGADWIWIMDDDSRPSVTALEQLRKVALNACPEIGFLCSKVIWNDGTPHLMNIPDIGIFTGGRPFNEMDSSGLLLINSCSFVSMFVSCTAVRKAGLPIREFYIWYDDVEFTRRLRHHGYLGGYVQESIVHHNTLLNHQVNIYLDSPVNLWKYKHALRNELFMVRQLKGTKAFIAQFFKRLFIFPFRILRRRKDNHWAFIKVIWSTAFSATVFKPSIEKLR